MTTKTAQEHSLGVGTHKYMNTPWGWKSNEKGGNPKIPWQTGEECGISGKETSLSHYPRNQPRVDVVHHVPDLTKLSLADELTLENIIPLLVQVGVVCRYLELRLSTRQQCHL